MGRIAKILDIIRALRNEAKVTDVKADPGGGALALAEQFTAAGDDCHPMPDDYAIFIEVPRGGYACVGNIDTKNQQTAERGERRIYSRNSDGEQVAQVYLKNDGTILCNNDEASLTIKPDGTIESINSSAAVTIKPSGEVETTNGSGYITLQAGGTVEINTVTIDPSGNITTPATVSAGVSVSAPTMTAVTSLTVAGIEMDGHTHAYSWTDPAGSGNTDGPNA